MQQSDSKDLPVAINDCHQLLAGIVPQLDNFPRARRFTLGEKLEMLLIEVLEFLLEAAYQKGEVNYHIVSMLCVGTITLEHN